MPVETSAIDEYQTVWVELEFLHADTTSVYIEGGYEEGNTQERRCAGTHAGGRLQQGRKAQRNQLQFALTLTTSGRVPVWYRAWDGNQTDDAMYAADLSDLAEDTQKRDELDRSGLCQPQ